MSPILVAFLVLILTAAIAVAGDRPNILIIQADDLAVSAPTPNLDAIAQQGITLTEMHAAAMCTPARTDLTTSRHHERFRLNNALGWRDASKGLGDVPSLPRFLAAKGYTTALFGKWHLGRTAAFSPLNHYGTFRGTLGGQIDQFTHRNDGGEIDWWNGTTRDTTVEYTTTAITSYAIGFMQGCREPWFMTVAYTAVHVPNQAPDRTISYARQLADFDRQAAALISAVPDNTIVIFVGDNGMGGAGLRGNKGSVYEGGLRIPAFIRWDGHLQPGGSIARVASLTDIAPTIAELIGVPLTIPTDGVSLAPALTGRPWGPTRDLFFSSPDGKSFGEFKKPWKLVLANGTPQLFRIDTDTGETRNVAGANPGQVATMRANITAWRKQVGR